MQEAKKLENLKKKNKLFKKFTKNTTVEEKIITEPDPTTKQCPYCFTEINIQATRCPHCTSKLIEK